MTSQRVERTWIRTGSYGRFRGEWVNHFYDYRPNWTPLSPVTITYDYDYDCDILFLIILLCREQYHLALNGLKDEKVIKMAYKVYMYLSPNVLCPFYR